MIGTKSNSKLILIIYFRSFLPMSYKYNFISTLLHRGFMIYSSFRALHNEILKPKQIFGGTQKNLLIGV